MTRTLLDAQLQEIRTKILQLGALVETALEQALQAVQNRDQAVCGLVIESDRAIDDLRFEVEGLAFHSLTLQQPLAGRDLRFLSSAPAIAGDLERTGDNAMGIAKLLLRMAPLRTTGTNQVQLDLAIAADEGRKRPADHALTEDCIVCGLLELGQEALRMLRGTMQAFEQNDAQAARTMWQADDVVDVRYHLVRHEILTMLTDIHAIAALQQDARIMQRLTYWLWIAHKLERVGDHCTKICERIVFILEGEASLRPSEEA